MSNTGTVAAGTYETVFTLSSNTTTVAKNDSGTISVSFKAAKITFTTTTPNSTLTLVATSGQSKRLIALDEDIMAQAAQSKAWTDTDTIKKQSSTTTFTIATPGEHYITFDNSEHKLSSISLNCPKVEALYTINSISATIVSELNTVKISDVKFGVVGSSTPIAANGYKVYLDDNTTEAAVTNGVIENVDVGTHKVTLKYGEYTVKEYNVEVGITTSSTYVIRSGVSNGVVSEATTIEGTTGAVASGKINVDATTGKLYVRDVEWAQFTKGAKLSFFVKAGAKVTLSGYQNTTVTMTGLEGDQTFAANYDTISKKYTEDTVVTIEAKTDDGYIGTLTIEYPISTATEILFGTDGNASSSIPGVVITANANNNGGNNAYVYQGNVEFTVAAGARVEVYSNYVADYTINGTHITTAGQAFYDYNTDTDVVIQCDLDGNGDNNFYWIKITFPNA